MKKLTLVAIVLGLLLVNGCNISLNSNPPDYLKQFTVYKEGDGIIVYFVLADKDGQMTTSDGEATLSFVATHYDYPKEIRLLDYSYPVRKENFVRAKIGRGPFEQEVIMFSIGRIHFQSFRYDFEALKEKNWKGKVRLNFSGAGRSFKGEETFYF